jgi:hypothetical protein
MACRILLPIGDARIYDPNLIGSPVVTRTECDGPSNAKKKKKQEEFQEINNASDETAPDSLGGGGGEKVNQEEGGEEENKEEGKVTPLKYTLTEAKRSKK